MVLEATAHDRELSRLHGTDTHGPRALRAQLLVIALVLLCGACAARRPPTRALDPDEIEIAIAVDGERWTPVATLHHSGADGRDYEVDVDAPGRVRIRFGDGVHGRRPPAGATVTASYRSGSGASGSMSRPVTGTTTDQDLWVVVRDRTQAISFGPEPPCDPACRCVPAPR